jgi:ribosomal protein L23
MLAFRRRGMCTFQMNIKAMEKKASALAPSLPAGLKEIAEQGASISEELSKFASERPELYKSVLDAIAKADKPGITATVAVAKDPKACKYTLEGTMLHDLMQNVAKVDRRMKEVGELEVTLTAADKAAIKEAVEALFKVKVTKVNTLTQKGKVKRFRGFLGRRSDVKKAIVTLAEGQSVDISTGL